MYLPSRIGERKGDVIRQRFSLLHARKSIMRAMASLNIVRFMPQSGKREPRCLRLCYIVSRSLTAANTYDVSLQYSRARNSSRLGDGSRRTRGPVYKLTVTVYNNITSVFLDGLQPCFDVYL